MFHFHYAEAKTDPGKIASLSFALPRSGGKPGKKIVLATGL
jgi:hypothetical protein